MVLLVRIRAVGTLLPTERVREVIPYIFRKQDEVRGTVDLFSHATARHGYLDRLTFRTKVGRIKICKIGYLGRHYSMFILK